MPPPDSLLLKLSVAKNLIDQDLAKEVYAQSQAESRPALDILLERGVLTPHIAENLLKEVERAQSPKTIGGFRIVSKLGQGGMGAVYKAVQVSMDREVALKVIAPEFAKDKEACDRFIREGRAAGKVNHPNVITCYDVGQDGKILYMAMELVLGGDADKAAKATGGRLPERRALEIIRDAARGLAAIHAVGLIHRDIKPANIFLTSTGEAKLADLGLARSTSGDDRMTMSGATVGTPAFMSPEQADGAPDVDIRGDIYALGATLYALVCGQPPFRGSSPWAVVAAVLKDPFPDPRLRGCSDAVAAVIEQSCQKSRSERYQEPLDLVRVLESLLGDAPQSRSPTTAGRSGPPTPTGDSKALDNRPLRSSVPHGGQRSPVNQGRPIHRAWILGSLGVIVTALLVGTYLVLRPAGDGIPGDRAEGSASHANRPPGPSAASASPAQPVSPASTALPGSAQPATAPTTGIINQATTAAAVNPASAVAPALSTTSEVPLVKDEDLRKFLPRFVGRWEPITDPVPDGNGNYNYKDPRNQALLVHADSPVPTIYIRKYLTGPWGGYAAPIVAISSSGLRLKHASDSIGVDYSLQDDGTLLKVMRHEYVWEGRVICRPGDAIVLRRVASMPPRQEWEPTMWKEVDGLWRSIKDPKHQLFIDGARRFALGSFGWPQPLSVDPLIATVIVDEHHRFFYDAGASALVWMEGNQPLLFRPSDGQGWTALPMTEIGPRTPVPNHRAVDDPSAAAAIDGAWGTPDGKFRMVVSFAQGTISLPDPGVYFVDRGVPEGIPRALRPVSRMEEYDLLRTVLPFTLKGQSLVANCRAQFGINRETITVRDLRYLNSGQEQSLVKLSNLTVADQSTVRPSLTGASKPAILAPGKTTNSVEDSVQKHASGVARRAETSVGASASSQGVIYQGKRILDISTGNGAPPEYWMKICAERGAKPVLIDSVEKLNFIVDYLNSIPPRNENDTIGSWGSRRMVDGRYVAEKVLMSNGSTLPAEITKKIEKIGAGETQLVLIRGGSFHIRDAPMGVIIEWDDDTFGGNSQAQPTTSAASSPSPAQRVQATPTKDLRARAGKGDNEAFRAYLVGLWAWAGRRLTIEPDLRFTYTNPPYIAQSTGTLSPQWDGRVWRITGLFWNLEFDATTERLLVVDKETGAFKDGWHWQRADPNETPEVSPAPPPSAVPATGAITTAPAVPQTHGMAVLRSVGKASLWVNGLRLGETAGEEAGLTAPVSLSAGDVIVIASTAERSSGVVLGWRGPGNMAVVTRADRWVLLRGAETDISSLTTDMLDQVKTRPTVARGLSKAEAEIREVLGGTTVQALTGPTNGSQFLVAIRLKPEDFITIPKTSP